MRSNLRTRDIKRLSSILTIAAKHGFGFVIAEIGLERYLPRSYRKLKTIFRSSKELPVQLSQMLEELGPTFVKIGQVLSVRPDLLPLEYIDELEKLQDSVPPFDTEKARKIFQDEVGVAIEDAFLVFDKEPTASASLSQVYKATLKDGKKVAVKIQRPEAEQLIELDLRIMRFVAEIVKDKVKHFNTLGLWEEFALSLRRELDFTIEAGNAEKFKANFNGDPYILIPSIYKEYTTKKVLTIDYIEGWKLTDINKAVESGIDNRFLAEYGAKAFVRQVIDHGYFHADLHPANILITPEGKIAFLDFGMVGKVTDAEKDAIARMLLAILKKDVEKLMEQAEELGATIPRSRIPAMKKELKTIIDRYYGRTLGETSIDIIGREFIGLLHRNNVKIPKDYALLIKALVTIEGVGKMLYPDINILEVVKPYIEDFLKKHYKRGEFVNELYSDLKELSFLLLKLPKKTDKLLSLMDENVEIRREQAESLNSLAESIKESANILSLTIISTFIALSFMIFVIFAVNNFALKLAMLVIIFITFVSFCVVFLRKRH